MNKKIFTLLAAGLMGGLSVNAAITDGKLHQLTFTDRNQVEYALSVGKSKVTGGDSLVMVKAVDQANFMKDAYKKTLWKISKGYADNTEANVYTFTNYATGSVLSLDLSKAGTALVPGQSQWLENAGEITAIKGGTTYGIGVKDVADYEEDPTAEPNYQVFVTKKNAEITSFSIATPAPVSALKAEQINGLYGTASAFEFTKQLQGNPIDGVGFRAQEVTGTNYVNFLLNTGKYLVVDTTTWQNAVNAIEYWKLTTDAKPAAATTTTTPPYITSALLKNGRSAEMYAFQVAMDIASGYVMTITPQAVPKYANSEERGKQTKPSFNAVATTRPLVYGQFAGGALVLAATSNKAYADDPDKGDKLSTATVKFGKVDTPSALSSEYVYYVQDYEKRISANDPTDAEATVKNPKYKHYATSECREEFTSTLATIPSYMWYVAEDGSLTNMMTDQTYNNNQMSAPSIVLVDEAEGLYKFDGETLKLTKGPKIEDAQKMAYRTISDADLLNGALSFRLVSNLANDLYIVEGKGGVLAVANSELADAQKLKVDLVYVDADGDGEADEEYYTVGNGVRQPVYEISNRQETKWLTFDSNGQLVLSSNQGAMLVSFKATGVEDQYQIVLADVGAAITANAATGILYLNNACDKTKNNIFEFAKKDAPTYGAPAYGHVQITTLEDDNKMIAPQLDGFAALKAEGQILKSDVYTNDTLKLWLDTAFIVEDVIPFYYLSSSAFNEEGEMRNFLANPFTLQAEIDAYNNDPETEPEDEIDVDFNYYVVPNAYRAAFIPAAVCGKDSLSIAGKDTIDVQALNPAAIAFKVVVDEGDEVYNIVSELKAVNPVYGTEDAADDELPYLTVLNEGEDDEFVINTWYLAQLNNVLFWTQDEAKAEAFVINRTTAPTANEAVEAETVKVIGGQGVVTVQGAAGKVITVANILGQTIANQVAASDNVTIAAPAGVVVVSVDGEATKVVVK